MSRSAPDPRLPSLALFQTGSDVTFTRASLIRIPSRALRHDRDVTSAMSMPKMAALRLASVLAVLVLFLPYFSMRDVSFNSYTIGPESSGAHDEEVPPAPDQPSALKSIAAPSLSTSGNFSNDSITGENPYTTKEEGLNTTFSFFSQSKSTNYALLRDIPRNGYLLGNASWLTFHPYDYEVDLRILVLAFNRSRSLRKCLNSLAAVDFLNSSVSLHVWIDRIRDSGAVDQATYEVARSFSFLHGAYHVHVQPSHVGIQLQWINCWRPRVGSSEIAVILEDDLVVSRFFWRWLRPAHLAYDSREDVSGYGLSHPGISHLAGLPMDIPDQGATFFYRVICTWGFSPSPSSWQDFQEWFYQTAQRNPTFQPLVPDILPTQWFLQEAKEGRQNDLWEMWHIYFTHNHNPTQYTVLLNTPSDGLLAVNRHEIGTHDKGLDSNRRLDPLCTTWNESYTSFPADPPKFGYDGHIENEV